MRECGIISKKITKLTPQTLTTLWMKWSIIVTPWIRWHQASGATSDSSSGCAVVALEARNQNSNTGKLNKSVANWTRWQICSTQLKSSKWVLSFLHQRSLDRSASSPSSKRSARSKMSMYQNPRTNLTNSTMRVSSTEFNNNLWNWLRTATSSEKETASCSKVCTRMIG